MNKTPSHTGSTLRLKILAIYIIFGFLAIFTTSILVSGYALDKLTDYTASRLYKSANVTASQYLPKYFNETISLSEVRTQLSGIESYTDAAVWLVDAEGDLICSKSPDDYPDAPTVIPDFDPTENVGSIWQKSDYHGCFTEDVITVIAPVTQDFTTKGYLLIHQNLDEINALQNALLQRVYIALIIIYLLSFMIFLAFELLVHRPLVEITQAATQYASGNLNYEIPIRTSDEMGYLSASLNYMSSQLRDMENYQKKFFEDKTWGGQEGSRYNAVVHTHAQFAGMITRLDYYVGEVLKKLKEKGLDENTLVIFSSDNGPHEEGGADPTFFGRDGKLRGLKRQCYEGGIRIPFIARWPGHVPAGTVNDHICAFYDLMPTFCEIIGEKNYVKKYTNKNKEVDYFDGISFAPTLLGKKKQKEHDFLYWEFNETNQIGVRMGDWKIVVKKGVPFLYNLATDIHEDNNVADQHPEIVEKMKTIIFAQHTPNPYFSVTLPEKK